MLKDVETRLLQAKAAQDSPEAVKQLIAELIRQLPETNSQGEIKDEVDNNQLATVEVNDTHLIYIKYGDRARQLDGLKIVAAINGTSIESETFPRDGELEETP